MALLKTLEEEIDIKTSNQNPHVDTFVVNRISPMRDTYDADLPRNGDSRVNKLNG